MSRLRLVRDRRLFAPLDAVVYAILLLLVGVLFAVFVFGGRDRAAEGIRVEVRGEAVYRYEYGAGGWVAPAWSGRIAEREEGEVLYVRIVTEEGWNELAIDLAQKSVRMNDADCSRRKDCTHMAPVQGAFDVIVCLPHALKVLALKGGEDISHPVIG